MSNHNTEHYIESSKEAREEREIANDLESYQTIRYLQQLESKFIKASRAAYIVEECQKIIENACKNNPKGLPF